MAKQAVADGIQTLVATPHSFNGIYLNPFQVVEDNVNRLRKTFQKNRININLCTGSEVRICTGLKQKVITKEVATINNNGRYVLVEFPLHVMPPGSREELFQLKLNDITPILAHPERNPIFQHQPELLSDLMSMGCLIQITAMSITGQLGREAMECAHKLLKNRHSHVIATDAHSPVKPAGDFITRGRSLCPDSGEPGRSKSNGYPQSQGHPGRRTGKGSGTKTFAQKKWWFNLSLKKQ